MIYTNAVGIIMSTIRVTLGLIIYLNLEFANGNYSDDVFGGFKINYYSCYMR